MRRALLYVVVCSVATVTGAQAATLMRTTRGEVTMGGHRAAARAAMVAQGRAEAFSFKAQASGTVSAVSVYLDRRTRARELVVGLYSNHRHSPGARLRSAVAKAPRPGAWRSVRVRPVSVRKGATYWIALLGRGGRLGLRARSSSDCHAQVAVHGSFTTLPRMWPTGVATSTCVASAYATGVTAWRAQAASAILGRSPTRHAGNPPKVDQPPTGGTTTATTPTSTTTTPTQTATTPTPPTIPLLSPQNTTAPVVSGNPVQGQTLSASTGTWANSPTSYGYQWQDCDSSGAGCTAISGATGQTYSLTSTDVGHTIRAAVAATNATGSSTAGTAPTSVVTAAVAPPVSCFSSPGSCGYPDPAAGNVGAGTCSSLPTWSPADLPSGDYSLSGSQVTITAPNVSISGYNIGNYFFYVEASHFTLSGDCINFNGSSWSGGPSSATTVWGNGAASYLTVESSTLISQGCTDSATSVCTGSGVNETLITSGGSAGAMIKNNILAGAVEDINGIGSGSTVQDNYIVANGMVNGAHSEDVFEQDTQGVTFNHNTLLNPMDQSAVIFGQVGTSGTACDNQFTITNNLIAGGGWPLTLCNHASSVGTSAMTITGNHFARCTTSPTGSYIGGEYCGTTQPTSGSAPGAGADFHGYWPNGGYFGLTDAMYCSTAGWNWSGNVWDDNGASVGCV